MRNEVRENRSIVRRTIDAVMFRFGFVRYSELTSKGEDFSKKITSMNIEIKKLNKDLDFYKSEYEAAWSLLIEFGLTPNVEENKKTSKKTRKTCEEPTHRGPYDKTDKTLTPKQIGVHTRTLKSGKVIEIGPFVRSSWVKNGKLAG